MNMTQAQYATCYNPAQSTPKYALPTHLCHFLPVVPCAKPSRKLLRQLHAGLRTRHDGHDGRGLVAQLFEGVLDGAVLVGVQVVVLHQEGGVDGTGTTGSTGGRSRGGRARAIAAM